MAEDLRQSLSEAGWDFFCLRQAAQGPHGLKGRFQRHMVNFNPRIGNPNDYEAVANSFTKWGVPGLDTGTNRS